MPRGLQTKDQIETAAIKLFAEHGYDGTSMRNISKLVGVSEAAIYRHYANKEELGREVYRQRYANLANELLDRSEAHTDLESSLIAMTEVFFEHLENDPAVLCFLLSSQHKFLPDIAKGENNVIDAITECIFTKTDSPPRNKILRDLITAMVVGLVLQPGVAAMYERLPSDLRGCKKFIQQAVVTIAKMELEDKQDD